MTFRPLHLKKKKKSDLQLLNIILSYVAPNILQSHNSKGFCNKIIEDLKITWPELKVIHDKLRPSLSVGTVKRAKYKSMLKTWMQDNQSISWSHGLKFIQFMKN